MTGTSAVDAYLAQVETQLPRRGRARGEILDELRDGLSEALERHPGTDSLVREFGDPREVGAAMARELALRVFRRHAAQTLFLLLLTSLGWYLYEALVGVSRSAVPSGGAAPVFLIGIEVLRGAIAAALVGAVLTVVATSLPTRRIGTSVPTWLGRATAAALVVFVVAVLTMLISIAPAHRPGGILLGVPVVAVALLALVITHRAVRNRAPRTAG
ncbi:hypothetical protein [Promicromonospora sp. NPDC023987]|uniref:HAAS signaling domain-containing protein n=1 Tax=Promicromonospora sp. NPDC023987 TaxID=3155360 RepID=UPI0033C46445